MERRIKDAMLARMIKIITIMKKSLNKKDFFAVNYCNTRIPFYSYSSALYIEYLTRSEIRFPIAKYICSIFFDNYFSLHESGDMYPNSICLIGNDITKVWLVNPSGA